MRQLFPLCILLYLLASCTGKTQNGAKKFKEPPVSKLSGKELAVAHCSRCHAFVSPELLTKTIWKQSVLPAMGNRMGIYNGGIRPDSLFDAGVSGDIVRNAGIYPESPVLAKEDWHKIEQYFIEHAPDTLAVPIRKSPIRMGLPHFKYREASFANRPALTTMVKILPDNRGVVFSDGKRRPYVLTFLTADLKENYSIPLQATPVQFDEKSDGLYLTFAGKGIFPTDASMGYIQRWVKNESQPGYTPANTVIQNLQRPVCVAYGDLNNDGREDIVACEFGNQTGELAWYENNGNGSYTKRVLRDKPGAIKAIIKDANNDGLPDIYVLMAQGDEGIFLYENQGAGKFKEKRLLSFLPLNGSQYMELADFNKDGLLCPGFRNAISCTSAILLR